MARKSRKQTAAPMPAPSLYVHVALYIRLSVEDNKKRGCSVENQKLVLNDFLSDKPDFVVYDTYIDNGATGTNFHRPGFQQMLSDIEAGHINCVIVKDLSRLGRNSIDTGYYIEQYFHAHNVRFIAVTDQFDTADSGNLHGGIMLPLKNMINERGREFAWEGWRRQDLVRWDKFAKGSWTFKEALNNNSRDLFPIPYDQITKNQSWKQNPGY